MEQKKDIKELIRKIGVIRFLLLLICGIFLLLVSLPEKESNKVSENVEKETVFSSNQNDIYVEKMEERLEKILATIEGAGKVEVMITLAASAETIVNKDQTHEEVSEKEEKGKESFSNVKKEETVFTEETGKQKPYVIKTVEPVMEGIIIVMEGGKDSFVVTEVMEAVQALFPIEPHKIGVLKMEDGQ